MEKVSSVTCPFVNLDKKLDELLLIDLYAKFERVTMEMFETESLGLSNAGRKQTPMPFRPEGWISAVTKADLQ